MTLTNEAKDLSGSAIPEIDDKIDTVVVNLFGAPSAGKTTTAAELFAILKKAGTKAAQIQEYATYLITAGRHRELHEEQGLLFSKQNHRQQILRGKVEFAVTESPLLLSSFYAPADYPESFHKYALDIFNTYKNINFYLHKRSWDDYDESTRIHKKEEAMLIEREKFIPFLEQQCGLTLIQVPADADPAPWIAAQLLKK